MGYNCGLNWKKLKQCITFPLKDKNGCIPCLYGRSIINTSSNNIKCKDARPCVFTGKHYYSENRKGLYPDYPNENTEILIIFESIIDAASLLQAIGSKDGRPSQRVNPASNPIKQKAIKLEPTINAR